MTPEQWRAWIGTQAATRLINQLWPDEVSELAIKEMNDALLIRHARAYLMADTVSAWYGPYGELIFSDPIDPRRI